MTRNSPSARALGLRVFEKESFSNTENGKVRVLGLQQTPFVIWPGRRHGVRNSISQEEAHSVWSRS